MGIRSAVQKRWTKAKEWARDPLMWKVSLVILLYGFFIVVMYVDDPNARLEAKKVYAPLYALVAAGGICVNWIPTGWRGAFGKRKNVLLGVDASGVPLVGLSTLFAAMRWLESTDGGSRYTLFIASPIVLIASISLVVALVARYSEASALEEGQGADSE